MPKKNSPAVAETQTSRRELLKKAAYVAPAILTLTAIPSLVSSGSKDSKEKTKTK
jgi:hypothetical protein